MGSSTIVLGLNAFHADSAAALVIGGEVVAAAEEERFRRVKHWAGFPSEAIKWCLEAGAIEPERLTHVAVNTSPVAARWRRLRYLASHWPDPRFVIQRLGVRRKRLSALELLASTFPRHIVSPQIVPIEHHLAHLASAFLPSRFEEAVCLSVDGLGDFASAAWGLGQGATITIDGRVDFPHSLGIFYQAMTQFLGFPNYGDEYKVMGLAPYGEPTLVNKLSNVVRCLDNGSFALNLKYFVHHKRRITFDCAEGTPAFENLYSSALIELLGPARRPDEELTQRHKDIARSVQVTYETALFALLRKLHDKYKVGRLALSGGCAQNSVANGKISAETPFNDIYVAAAGYDAGGAIGAALLAFSQRATGPRVPLMHAQLGPAFDSRNIDAVLAQSAEEIKAHDCIIERFSDAHLVDERAVSCMLEGGVVGWFQGRMEWGARALGQRSILADPRRSDIKEILNRKIKRRESFRPFAPSVLRESVNEWFESDGDVPFMSSVFPVRPERRAAIPAVTHVDGSGRLQTVTMEDNPRYHQLISCFARKTGVPMILNTSFNENETVVCRPEEALACFLRTKMDMLVLGDVIVSRR